MKIIQRNSITNIPNTDIFDNTFVFPYLEIGSFPEQREVFFMRDLLSEKKNQAFFETIGERYAMYENVYSQKDEKEIFEDLVSYAFVNNKKIHIIGITLDEEVQILEEYYKKLGFLREDKNAFEVDFSFPLVTVSVHIENLMWRGSDYKKMGEKIFFIPPIREAGLTKAMFKGINRGVIAGIYFDTLNSERENFLVECVLGEKILPLMLSQVLFYNLVDIGFGGEEKKFHLKYDQKEIYK